MSASIVLDCDAVGCLQSIGWMDSDGKSPGSHQQLTIYARRRGWSCGRQHLCPEHRSR